MSQLPAPAPAPHVNAPAPQGKLTSRKLRVVVFDHYGRDCKSLTHQCQTFGCEVTVVRVHNPKNAALIRDHTYLNMPDGEITRGVCSAQDAAAIIRELKPDVVCTPGVKTEDVAMDGLLNDDIPAAIPQHIDHLVDSATGYIINAKDGKAGQLISTRAIDAKQFLTAKAQKIAAAEGRG